MDFGNKNYIRKIIGVGFEEAHSPAPSVMKFKAAVNATLSREKVVVHWTYDHEFDCQSGHDCLATLDSLFTPLCP